MLVKHNKNFRHSWMIPRNIRRIDSHKIARILCLIEKNLSEDWEGNIQNQKKFTKLLEEYLIKKVGDQRDKNSGGARTYLNQLEKLGLVFKKDKNYYLTISGETILEGSEAKKVIQNNLLNLQYPSTYSRGKNCRLNPDIKVKPFLLILNILEDPEIKYLTDYEIIIITVLGHNFNCKEVCIDKIKELRNFTDVMAGLKKILTPYYHFMTSVRTKNQSINKLIKNHKNNANTFGNYLQATNLVIEGDKVDNKKTLRLNQEYLNIYHHHLKNKNNFIQFDNDEQFQRNFGKYKKLKDTRTIEKIKSIKGEIPDEEKIIKQYFFDNKTYENPSLNSLDEKFYQNLYQKYGFEKDKINEVIEPLIQKNFEDIFVEFIEISKQGLKYNLRFEKDIQKIFQNYWGFYTHLTGQIKRNEEGGGAYSDIFVVNKDMDKCSLVDAKAIKNYSLPNNDRLKMINSYAANYKELENKFNYKSLELDFILYVTSTINKKSNVEENCTYMSKEIKTPVSVISSFNLVMLARKYRGFEYQNKIRKIFSKNGVINEVDIN